ncbi:hypothetical protein H4Q26_008656 [Puccinia striiformis f. sp. tritici PST-130]|nr:hypothetical protein H4Q26_008656 [Puccinia striiformis f. sp. tritici PST-130]
MKPSTQSRLLQSLHIIIIIINYEQSVAEAETELLNRSLELIESYLSQSDDRSLRLVINLHESPFDSSVTQDQTQLDEVGSSLPIDSLGEDALENCIPPPYCSPSLSGSESLLSGGDRSNCSSIGLLDSQRARLKSLKPWHSSLHSPPDQIQLTISSYSQPPTHLVRSKAVPHSSHHRPLQSSECSDVDYNHLDPIRLSLFWKVICIICEKRKLGDVSATALCVPHTSQSIITTQLTGLTSFHHHDNIIGYISHKDILPYIKSISATGILVSPEPEDVYGDHIRIWSNLQPH